MTTKSSPIKTLKAQANHIAATLKAAERGEKVDARFAQKIAEARGRDVFKVGIVMDDKIITLEMPWAKIREASEPSLAEYILGLMREARDAIH